MAYLAPNPIRFGDIHGPELGWGGCGSGKGLEGPNNVQFRGRWPVIKTILGGLPPLRPPAIA